MLVQDALWQEIESWMLQIRRSIHRHPELGLDTPHTQAIIEEALDELGISHTRPIAHGVKAQLGPPGNNALLLRADMDGLPVTEIPRVPFASEITGRMHACGHDCHTAMLLGAARYLKAHESELTRPLVLMFQPAEEGPGGALPMIDAGVLENPGVTEAAMIHVSDNLPAGVIGLREGPAMGGCDDFSITVHGKGGHGSAPHTGVDAIFVASAMVQALQSLVSREQDPLDPLVVSVGTIHGGYRENIIADRVEMTGTIRSLTASTRKRAVDRVQAIVAQVADLHQAKVEIQIDEGYPPAFADVEWTRRVKAWLERQLGPDHVRDIARPTMGVEDFAYVAERVHATILNVGIVGEGFTTGLHSAGLLVDEKALRYGAAAFAAIGLGS